MFEPSSAQAPPADLTLKNSSLISGALYLFYGALTLPLPILAFQTQAPIPVWLLGIGLLLGLILLAGALSYRVHLNSVGMAITYPAWVPGFLRREWTVAWSDIVALRPRGTSQGGLVYYLQTNTGLAYLLPMRVAGFSRMLDYLHTQTGLETKLIRPLAQAWMYGLLGLFALGLFLIDAWIILNLPPVS